MLNIIHDTVRFIGAGIPQSCAYDIIIYTHDVDTHCIWICGREASTNLEIFHMVPHAVLSTEVDTVMFHTLPLQEAPMTHIRYPFNIHHDWHILHIHACT